MFQAILPDHQIKVVRDGSSLRPVWNGPYKGNDSKNIIALRLKNNHFDHVKRLARLFNSIYYCNKCDKCYSHLEDHYRCPVRCIRCCHYDTTDCDGTDRFSCMDCRMTCMSEECFSRHRIPFAGDAGRKSACTENRLCQLCDKPIYQRTGAQNEHICGLSYCRTCTQQRADDHPDCYQRPLQEKEEDFQAPTIFFDIESTFEEERDGKTFHKANLCIAFKCCRKCWDKTPLTVHDIPEKCSLCNDDRLKIWHSFDDPSIDPIECLVDWLEEEQHEGYTLVAHNLKGYDGHFAIKQVLSRSDEFVASTYNDEDVILAGRKLMTAKIGKTRAVDSHNFIPCALSEFTKMFALGEERKKGYFPYLFNMEENYDYVGPLPPLDQYGTKPLSTEKKEKLAKWHEERTAAGDIFNLRRDIVDYCFSDVMLLCDGAVKFSKNFYTNAGVWPLHECLTAASAALKCYRRRFMRDNTMLADKPICLQRRQSSLALKFFEWKRHTENLIIQFRTQHMEERGELVGRFFLDGFVEDGGRGRAMEVKGCYFHMHDCRYTDESDMRGKSALRIRDDDASREAKIREHHELEIYWECDIQSMIHADPVMEKFFKELIIYDPIYLRDSFCGGRTEPFTLRFETKPDSNMRVMYVDFCSLYPSVNKYRPYPSGGMRTIQRDQLPKSISSKEELNSTVKGFLFCKVLPPRRLYAPVLPLRKNGKLIFLLCERCCDEQSDGFCYHTDEERTLTGTWATVELELALEKGYRIIECLEAVHYDSWSVYERDVESGEVLQHGLYSAYMDNFIKLKAEASGWPAGVETDEQQEEYLRYFKQMEGVQLEKEKVEKNGPARASSKLLLNSLWGKTAENPIRSRTLITSNYDSFFKIISQPGVSVQGLLAFENSDRVELSYKQESISTEPLISNSIAVACLTTAYARVQLYRALDRIRPERLLYVDTDSIIFAHDTNEPNPLQDMMGDTLGRLTDELPEGSRCVGFVSQGPKVYALRILNEKNGTVRESVKCRGFTLTDETTKSVNYDKISEHVTALIEKKSADLVPITYFKISTDREHSVYSHSQVKAFRPVYDKRVIFSDGSTRPFGWCFE